MPAFDAGPSPEIGAQLCFLAALSSRDCSASPKNQQVKSNDGPTNSQSANHTFLGAEDSDASPLCVQPLNSKRSSGRSSNADIWFEQSNREVQKNSTSVADDDPPFFIGNSSPSEPSLEAQQQQLRQRLNTDATPSLQLRTNLPQFGNDGSSTEGFRSIVDNRTVENQKLKRRLKKQEKLHDPNPRNESIFEMRVYNLDADKKRELVEILHDFAGSLFTQQDVPSQMPEDLEPRQNLAAMIEHAKKKLVVHRLEQLFACKDGFAIPHHQALKPQDVSQIAGRADRSSIEIYCQRASFSRNALDMNKETEVPLDARTTKQLEALSSEAANHSASEGGATQHFHPLGSSSEEQRSMKRPDLDLDRSQVIAENLRYISRLGALSEDPGTGKTPEEGQGWIYLNLLVNMAQLHTMNVTLEFVRKAISQLSGHYEMSLDGRMVRWKKCLCLAKKRRHGGDLSGKRIDDSIDGRGPCKRCKIEQVKGSRSRLPRGSPSNCVTSFRCLQHESSKCMYRPLFYHCSTEESANCLSEDDLPIMHQITTKSRATSSPCIRTISAKIKRMRDTGRIVFYNNARYYTDLSSDPIDLEDIESPSYNPSTREPVGKQNLLSNDIEHIFENPTPFGESKELAVPTFPANNHIPESMELEFPPPSTPRSDDEVLKSRDINFPVTGMGGIWPADNFTIDVQTRYTLVGQTYAPTLFIQTANENVPNRLAKILQADRPQREVRTAVEERVLNIKYIEHPPSKLPPALHSSYSDQESVTDDTSEFDTSTTVASTSQGLLTSHAPHLIKYREQAESLRQKYINCATCI